MKFPVLLISGLVILFIILGAFPLSFLRRLSRKALEEAMENRESEEIILSERVVNFFGIESAGFSQIRGNCALLLTDRGIRHLMWSPRRRLCIDWQNVLRAEEVKSHLGKTKFRQLVKVRFINERGERDSAAWYVPNSKLWMEAINGRARSAPKTCGQWSE